MPEHERDMILDNMGHVALVHGPGLRRQWHGQRRRRRNPGLAQAGTRPHGGLRRALREELPRRFPACTFFFQPADITSQILDFGLPAPINVQVVGVNVKDNLAVAQKLRSKLGAIPGIADVHMHQIVDQPTLKVDVDRVMASELGLTQQNVANSLLVSLSSTTQVTPNYWVNWVNGVNYVLAVQTPPDRISSVDSVMNTP